MIGHINEYEQADADFARARRRAAFGRLAARLWKDVTPGRLSCFEEVQRRLGAGGGTRLGIMPVRVIDIVGSVGRCSQFDVAFLPTSRGARTRWERIDRAFHSGRDLSPVSLYKIGDSYFVNDGNHRVSVARFHGVEWIDAEVTEFRAQVPGSRWTTRGPISKLRNPCPGWRRMPVVFVALLLLALIVGYGAPSRAVGAEADVREEAVRFESSGVTLRGTVLVPEEASSASGRYPAIALVHGAGPHVRDDQRAEAEAFAREGIVTLIYDKRTKGYSQIERSYDLLADDALAVVDALRDHPEVDPDAVGLWGLSEGAWVVPVAASRPEGREAVDFVVLVAASGVPPARQQSWNLENNLRHQGVSGSMVEAISRTGTRLLVGAGLFAEANHDPVAPLASTHQPVLALYGENDRVQPPAESAGILREALARDGNTSYEIRFYPDAEHGLRSSPDGFAVLERLAPGYTQTVASWVEEVARGEAPGPSIAGPRPEQARPSRPLPQLAWWESAWVQLGAMVVTALAFASYPATALVRRLRRPLLLRTGVQPKLQVRWLASCLAFAGLSAILGFIGYFGYLMFTAASAVGPILAGRPVPWLVLQALAVAVCVSAVLLAASWRSSIKASVGAMRARIGILLVGGAVFVAWAVYWGLLSP
jgi:uncharacterized protein